MHRNLQRLPAERVRHRKRLPFQGWPDAAPLARQNTVSAVFTAPATFTFFNPIVTTSTTSSTIQVVSTPLTTPVVASATVITPSLPGLASAPSDTILPSVPLPSAPAVSPAAPASPSAPPVVSQTTAAVLPPPSPIASAINPSTGAAGQEGAQNGPVSAVSSKQHGLPTGAVVGITIACVMLILGAFIFFIRQRAVRNRKLNRATAPWMTAPRPTNSSFEPAPYTSAAGAYTAAGSSMGETSPGVTFARAQTQAMGGGMPVPAMPAPMPSSYNNPMAPPAPAGGASATVRYEFIPSLPDELSITTGEVVGLVSEYDDGWALCKNARGDTGMVPLECLDRGAPAPAALQVEDYRNSRRTSSLAQRY